MKKKFFAIFIALAVLLNSFTVVSFSASSRVIETDVDDTNTLVIDVSKYQPSVNWSLAKNDIDGAILRIGNRFSSSRTIAIDATFLPNYTSAKAQGIPVGCYFYSTALNVEEVKEEADWIIQTLENNNCTMEFPIYFDMEDPSTESLGKTTLTNMARAFCDKMNEAGWLPGIYCSKSWAASLIDLTKMKDAAVWIAQYYSSCTYTGHYDMWQYTSEKTISGISGGVDASHCYKDFESYIKAQGLNGFEAQGNKPNETYIVTDENGVDVKRKSDYSGTVITNLPQNMQIFVNEVNGDYGKIKYNGTYVWIDLTKCTQLSKKESLGTGLGTYTVTATSLNVRKGPDTSYASLGGLPNGTVVLVKKRSGSWAMIDYNGADGWIHGDYIKFIGKVLFDSNKGTGMDFSLIGEKGMTVKIPETTFTRDGFEFKGWATEKNGNAVYYANDTLVIGDSNLMLYAVWEKIYAGETYLVSCSNTLNVRADKSSASERLGAVSNNQQVFVYEVDSNWGRIDFGDGYGWISLDYAKPLTETDCVSSKLGNYSVNATSLNIRSDHVAGSTSLGFLYSGETTEVTEIVDGWGRVNRGSITGWSSMSYLVYLGKVILDSNGGTGVNTVVLGGADGRVKLPECIYTRSGYKFEGWSTDSDGGELLKVGASVELKGENVILYAVWSKDSVEVYPADDSSTVVNQQTHIISGLAQGLTATDVLDRYVKSDGDISLEFSSDVIGTGTKLKLVRGALTEEYTFVIYGDSNGDSFADGCDAVLLNAYLNNELTSHDLPDGALQAFDVNHDSMINTSDFNVIFNAGLYLCDIAQ